MLTSNLWFTPTTNHITCQKKHIKQFAQNQYSTTKTHSITFTTTQAQILQRHASTLYRRHCPQTHRNAYSPQTTTPTTKNNNRLVGAKCKPLKASKLRRRSMAVRSTKLSSTARTWNWKPSSSFYYYALSIGINTCIGYRESELGMGMGKIGVEERRWVIAIWRGRCRDTTFSAVKSQ